MKIGMLAAQFAPYHEDRCAALSSLLGPDASVLAVEIAGSSTTYAWSRSGDIVGARKKTLFPDRRHEDIPWPTQLAAMLRALHRCDAVLMGVSYAHPAIVLLAFALRLLGVRVIMMTDSKFDDRPRHIARELVKAFGLLAYHGAIVAGARQQDYVRFLGFHRRPVELHYDCVSVERLRSQSTSGVPFVDRHFLYVGRFVPKKNLFFLLGAYARYRRETVCSPRDLRLVGIGELEESLRQCSHDLGVQDHVHFVGFREGPHLAEEFDRGLALLLSSTEEQWGLVVNEALAFSLPVIVSDQVGARDLLVRNLLNGFVMEPTSEEGWANAMCTIAEDEGTWSRMTAQSAVLAAQGDVARFAESVERMIQRVRP